MRSTQVRDGEESLPWRRVNKSLSIGTSIMILGSWRGQIAPLTPEIYYIKKLSMTRTGGHPRNKMGKFTLKSKLESVHLRTDKGGKGFGGYY